MIDDRAAAIRAAIQALLDAEGDGWHIAQYVVCMGLERVNSVGEIESTPWLWAPPSQADWMTAGLIESALDMHCAPAVDDDD